MVSTPNKDEDQAYKGQKILDKFQATGEMVIKLCTGSVAGFSVFAMTASLAYTHPLVSPEFSPTVRPIAEAIVLALPFVGGVFGFAIGYHGMDQFLEVEDK